MVISESQFAAGRRYVAAHGGCALDPFGAVSIVRLEAPARSPAWYSKLAPGRSRRRTRRADRRCGDLRRAGKFGRLAHGCNQFVRRVLRPRNVGSGVLMLSGGAVRHAEASAWRDRESRAVARRRTSLVEPVPAFLEKGIAAHFRRRAGACLLHLRLDEHAPFPTSTEYASRRIPGCRLRVDFTS